MMMPTDRAFDQPAPRRDQQGIADWVMHIAGMSVFLSAFAPLFILSVGVAAGLSIADALVIDLAAFAGGLSVCTLVRVQRELALRRAVACHVRPGLFARKDVQVQPAGMKKARAFGRPSLGVCDDRVLLPVV